MKDSSLDEILDELWGFDFEGNVYLARLQKGHKAELKRRLQSLITKREREAKINELTYILKQSTATEDLHINNLHCNDCDYCDSDNSLVGYLKDRLVYVQRTLTHE